MDSVGGMLDAFTSKEQICFNAKVLDEHLPIAFDVLADLVLRPKLDADDVKKERQVVLEEIKMDLDNPEYMLHDIFTRGFWPEHALGRPNLGTPETVKHSVERVLSGRFRKWFAPDQIVVTAAGNVTHEQVMALAEQEFGQLQTIRRGGARVRAEDGGANSPRNQKGSRAGTSLHRSSVRSAGR